MSVLRFFRANQSLLGFGLLTALSTSFGQTFFVSLFLLQFEDPFRITRSELGFVYAGATLVSALLLPFVGGRIDEADLGRYTTATMVGLALSSLVVALSTGIWMLATGLLGLRLFSE